MGCKRGFGPEPLSPAAAVGCAVALDTNALLVAVGLMIFGAFLGSIVFRRYRLPDILFLIGLGVLLGPAFDFVDIGVFRTIAPLVGTIAIIIILFDGGLEIKVAELRTGVAQGAFLGLVVFVATTLLCALVARALAGQSVENAVILGMTFGGAGVIIVLPLIQRMGVDKRAQTVVSLEAATSDVLVVTGVFGLSAAVAFQETDPRSFVTTLVEHFSIGILAGVLVGYAWVTALKQFHERSYEYVLTLAVLFLTYAVVEFLHGSGPIAVLVAGLVLGNSQKRLTLPDPGPRVRTKRRWELTPVFGVDLRNFHQEMVFFVRAFFFTALGVTLDLDVFAEPRFLLVGLLLGVAVMAARWWGVTLLFWKSRLTQWDKLSISLMFPLGLAAAALSLVPSTRFGLPGTENFPAYAAVVIVTTNLMATVLVYLLSQPVFRRKIPGGLQAPRSAAE